MKYLLIPLFCLCLQPAFAEDDEDFKDQEEGIFFDYPKTGLMDRKAQYRPEDSSKEYPVTYVPYYPTAYNSTNDLVPGLAYISHWEQDPPSFLAIYFINDMEKLTSKHEIDLEVTIGQHDRAKNLVVTNRRLFTDIQLEKGMNRIQVNIHNYKGDIVSVLIKGQRFKFPILPTAGKGD